MKKPILVTKPLLPKFEEYIEKIKEIWPNEWLTNFGPLHNELKEELKDYLLVDNISLFTNGHLALSAAIKALNLTGEVITTPYTFASTTNAIVENGLTPVFCDISLKDYNIDVNKIEELITDKTSAIVAVHVYGNPCDVEKIEEIAKKYNLKVIYDAAHAFGVKINSRGINEYGDASMLSFHATKVFNTIEGGAVCYKDNNLEKKFKIIMNFGIDQEKEDIEEIGTNAKMNEFQAAMGLCNLKNIEEAIERRHNIVNLYRKLLSNIDGITYLNDTDNVKHNYAYFPILIDKEKYGQDRNELMERLKEKDIYCRKYFYPLTSEFTYYKEKYKSNTEIAKYVSENILVLPLYDSLTNEDVETICSLIKEV